MIYYGIDWAEKTHDVALVDDTGQLLAKRHITDDAIGYKILLDLLAEYGDTAQNPIPVAIETSRGLLVAVLRTGSRQVFAINPMAAARYRDRHSVSRSRAISSVATPCFSSHAVWTHAGAATTASASFRRRRRNEGSGVSTPRSSHSGPEYLPPSLRPHSNRLEALSA